MKDFSIVIAHRGDPMGLWATIHSCEIELSRSKYSYEYCICANGEGETGKKRPLYQFANIDTQRVLGFLAKDGKLGGSKILQRSVSPPTARQIAAERAKGKLLFFFDNHCLVAKDYFDRAVMDFDKYSMDMLHSSTRFFHGDITSYEYQLKLQHNFWAESATTPYNSYKPYRIAAGGHGGFVVRKDVWDELGGYWEGFVGYGGEEIYFDLKAAMRDKTNWIDPLLIHYHYAGARPYARHYTDDFFRNMMMCANIVGGEKWLYSVYESFSKNFTKARTKFTMYDLLMQSHSNSAQYAVEFASKSKRTLDEQLKYFRDNDICC